MPRFQQAAAPAAANEGRRRRVIINPRDVDAASFPDIRGFPRLLVKPHRFGLQFPNIRLEGARL